MTRSSLYRGVIMYRELFMISSLWTVNCLEPIEVVPSSQQHLTIPCSSIYNTTLPFPATILNVVNVSIPDSHNASILINSTCCEQIQPRDVQCTQCFDGGEKMCFVNQNDVIDLHAGVDEECLNETNYIFTCHAQICNGTFPPGYETACTKDNSKQICLNNGAWETLTCDDVSTTWQAEQFVNQTEISMITIEENTKDPVHTGGLDLVTTSETSSLASSPSWTADVTSLQFETTETLYNDSTTISSLDDEEIKRDLINFLIALGVILVVVFIIVCGFFIRKAKKKSKEDDYSLEYWQSTEYIESICGKASCSINPLRNEMGQTLPSQRYIKKDDSSYYNAASIVDKQGSENIADNVDIPRRVKHDYTDKYVTTATGSNFYSYRTSPDVDLGDSGSDHSPPRIHRDDRSVDKMTSFKPKYSKKQRKGKKNRSGFIGSGGKKRIPGRPAEVEDEIYAVSYKNKLKSSLNDWSAEESDV